MQKNEGKTDRVSRIILGIIMISFVFIGPKTALGYIGIFPLATGIIGFCPLYKVFGLNTCPLKKSS